MQLADLKTQLDDAVAGRVKAEKSKRDLEAKVEELEEFLEESAHKVSLLRTPRTIRTLHSLSYFTG